LRRLKMCNNFYEPGRRISIKQPLRRTLVLFILYSAYISNAQRYPARSIAIFLIRSEL